MSSAHEEGAPYRRAADYMAASVIFLRGYLLLREPLPPEHIKHEAARPLGLWCPGITRAYAPLNTLVRERDADGLSVPGPGPRRPGQPRQPLAGGHPRGVRPRACPDRRRSEDQTGPTCVTCASSQSGNHRAISARALIG
ncbi:hypothetical protein [Streptomyces coerulescens]|uniref:Xylulose 5-phosphate/Fructose 6-phosphate phosphoketolase N-terminal domain-containing protein n=1 Tax=Streptomyces coerulescens TaxID=29304 RepID=A0ABW0CE61_STRCD